MSELDDFIAADTPARADYQDAGARAALLRTLIDARRAAGLSVADVGWDLRSRPAAGRLLVERYESGQLVSDAPLWLPMAYARRVGAQLRFAVMPLPPPEEPTVRVH